MAQIQISQIKESGELSWGLELVDDQQTSLLKSITPVSKAIALTAAKAIKHKGADAPLLPPGSEDDNRPGWVLEKPVDQALLRFTQVKETLFRLHVKLNGASEAEAAIEGALKNVQSILQKAEIKWIPPEADPAHGEKESDLTPTVGVPGS
ncbi:MAG: hypothetical protein F4010_02120 [Cenarchaeum sp. SB0669_bin_11]|nr:hypothetical protein [Gammaproteobacteria bacterium]MYL10952.1 hypothetical protein [Cenarchaeum sp. SB0669_bin_11]